MKSGKMNSTKLQKPKIVFVADFFRRNVLGGAESNDAVLLSFLEERGFEIETIHSNQLKVSDLVSNDSIFIVGNFIGLSEEVKQSMASGRVDYIIYEHDHKYLTTRDPSKFKDFKAPEGQIINREFYHNARAVVVLSKICKEVIEHNLGLTNVHNIGCSLWSEKRFDYIELLCNQANKNNKVAILRSNNPIKGTDEAIKYCEKKDIKHHLVSSDSESEFLQTLSEQKKVIFFPQVLETFSRFACEAKMLDCKLITKPKKLGFASESCFELSGVELIREMRNRVKNALSLFEKLILNESQSTDITAILTCYKRPHLLKEQIEALRNQSVPPKEIWVWINEPEKHDFDYEKIKMNIYAPDVKIFDCNHNWKFYGRFAAALLVDTEYVAIFDDDTIPGKDWLSNCLQTMSIREGILGGVGCILPGDRYYGHERVGWSAPNEEIVEVDLVGHAWFFKREWLQYLWREKPQTWDNGEDIQFSYLAQKYGGIKTFVPPHRKDKPEMFSSLKGMQYGIDEVATSNTRNHEVFYKQRNECVANAVKNGWKIIKER